MTRGQNDEGSAKDCHISQFSMLQRRSLLVVGSTRDNPPYPSLFLSLDNKLSDRDLRMETGAENPSEYKTGYVERD